ncbi:2Fe-2S iron-sulfur cluster binding domain-containing protein [Actinopolyspora alba]|uniref:2Fe-2S iron-sulfur cluster binding domain-containing protein n=1 Tax=Actinopolyspora alba TaxID=673379 RepID=A0A1I1YVP5_9ACTN|nr:2Fe-2S iron-sulfur cluster-binding protein [Actinopolyspora alba]SFE23382.1 2Fe-2S iron-sulfur cluster binding domain-containing protein [Actinopolyspora alba]
MTQYTLTILPTGTKVVLPAKSRLTEIEFEILQKPIPFGCRSGSCGVCVIEVLEGSDSLGQPDDNELDFLEDLGRPGGDHRLACQCRLYGNAKVRPAADT